MRVSTALIRHNVLTLTVLFVFFSAEAKKPVRKSKPAQSKIAFNTDWSNIDSLQFHYNQRKLSGDYATVFRIGDSLLDHPSMQSKVNVLTRKKIELLDSLGRKSEMLIALKNWRTALQASDSMSAYAAHVADGFESCNDFQSAYEIEQLITQEQISIGEKLQFSLDSLQKNSEIEKAKNTKSLQLANDMAQALRIFLWCLGALTLILAVTSIVLIVKQFKMRKQHEKLGAQMDHTRAQIEKAFEEGDRINIEIRAMKDQMARIEVEKKQLRQNIAESTSETLPLLRQQLDSLAKENTGALPVEKYMAIQNTITRLNKQLKDFA